MQQCQESLDAGVGHALLFASGLQGDQTNSGNTQQSVQHLERDQLLFMHIVVMRIVGVHTGDQQRPMFGMLLSAHGPFAHCSDLAGSALRYDPFHGTLSARVLQMNGRDMIGR